MKERLCEQICVEHCFYDKHRQHQLEHGGLNQQEKDKFVQKLEGDPYEMGCQKEKIHELRR